MSAIWLVALAASSAMAVVHQEGVVTTGGRDSPARNQSVTTRGECDGVPVFVKIDGQAGALEVGIGGRRRDVTGDIFQLEMGERGRQVAQTFLLCRPEGGLDVQLLFADARSGELRWTQQGFFVESDLSISRVGEPHALTEAEAAGSFY